MTDRILPLPQVDDQPLHHVLQVLNLTRTGVEVVLASSTTTSGGSAAGSTTKPSASRAGRGATGSVHQIGSGGAGLVELVFVDDEVFAQDRQRTDVPHGGNIGQLALKRRTGVDG